MKVYFEESNGELMLLSDTVTTNAEAYEVIDTFLEKRNYKSYYKFGYPVDDYVEIDVGSWSQFFRIYGYELR